MKYLFSFFLFFLGLNFSTVYAQLSESDIKLSDKYHWGEAFSTDRDEAIALARQDLVEGVSVLVTSDVSLRTEETEENVSSEFQSNVRTQSQMVLQGLNYLDQERRDGSWRVIAYISKDDLEKSIEAEKRRLSGKLVEATQADLKGEKNKALRLYTETYIDSYNIPPEPMYLDSTLFDSNINIRQYSREKIIDWLSNLELTVSNVESFSTDENVELYLELDAKIENQPANNLLVSLNKRGYGQTHIRNGSARIFYDRKPEKRKEVIEFRLEINPSILQSKRLNFARRILPESVKSVTVDFKDVIEIDFTANRLSDGSFRFTPNVRNISPYDIEWDFGNGNYSDELRPRYKFENNNSEEVTLMINQLDELSVTKVLASAGRIGFTREENTSFTARPVVLESGYVIPFQHRDYIERIRRMPNHNSLESYLQRLESSGILQMGGPNDVQSQARSYIIITNPDTEKVEDILSPERSGVRYVITDENSITFNNSEWKNNYKGNIPIWVEFN